MVGKDVADDFQIVHVHVRIEVEFLCLKFSCLIFDVVFEFHGVGGDFLVGDTGVEASIDSILLDLADDAFVGVVLLVFPAIGTGLEAHDLNQSLNFLFVYRPASILQLYFFCQYMKVDFGKLMAASIFLSWNCSRSLATILAFYSFFLPSPNSLAPPNTSFEW